MSRKEKKNGISSFFEKIIEKINFSSFSNAFKYNTILTLVCALLALVLIAPSVFSQIEGFIYDICRFIVAIVSPTKVIPAKDTSFSFKTIIASFIFVLFEGIACLAICKHHDSYIQKQKEDSHSKRK